MYHAQESKCFVPFCETVIRRYPTVQDLPPHDIMDPKLCHGEIRLTLTAKTPLIISGHKERGEAATFATDPRGNFRIPGSSLRGLIRQNMQILGLGLVRVGKEDEIPDRPVANRGRPADGLPESYRIAEDKDFLDYPRSIMGLVGRKRTVMGRRKPIKVNDCYRTRISVGDLKAVGTPLELRTVEIDQELPLQNDPGFIIQENGGFRLKGTRQYPLREVSNNKPYQAKQRFRPLAAGSQFTGSIRYRNLHPDELGLLLWCLRLEEGCLHTMGLAKAAGYGQVQLQIDALVEYIPEQLYSSLTAGGIRRGGTAERVAELIGIYQRDAAARAEVPSIPDLPHIRIFLSLKNPASPVSDPVPVQPPPPSQKELRKKAKQAGPQASSEQVGDWKTMLSGRFKGN